MRLILHVPILTEDQGRSENARKKVVSEIDKSEGIIGLTILCSFIFIAIAAPFLTSYTPADVSSRPLLEPSSEHPLGTDDVGRDIFSNLLYGSRTSLMVAVLVSLGVLVIGTLAGVFSGCIGGILTGL